jgi:hypothetical protein
LCDLVFTGGDSNSRIHIRNQANPQHMMDIAGDKLTGKTADDQVVFGRGFLPGPSEGAPANAPVHGSSG